jgi:hypothetical protein
MDPKNFKKQMWIGIGVVAGSMIIFGVAFFILVGNIQTQADAITTSRNDIASQSALVNSYSDLKANVAEAVTYQTAMDKLLATQDNLISFPSQIEAIAQNDGVTITFSFQGDPVPAGNKTVGYVEFGLNASGPLNGIIAFLNDIESATPILLSKVDTFDLTESGSSYTLAATGRVFFK